jgi:hypothetical protein
MSAATRAARTGLHRSTTRQATPLITRSPVFEVQPANPRPTGIGVSVSYGPCSDTATTPLINQSEKPFDGIYERPLTLGSDRDQQIVHP